MLRTLVAGFATADYANEFNPDQGIDGSVVGIGSHAIGLYSTATGDAIGAAPRKETTMNRVSRFVMTVVAATGLVAGMALATGPAQAQGPSYNGGNCPAGMTCTHWFPGDPPPPGSQVLSWDWNVPHDWYWNSEGIVDVTTNTMYPWSGGGSRPAAPPPAPVGPPPPPLQKPPDTPFCSPRGALIIIPPICDEIGVDWPPGSLKR